MRFAILAAILAVPALAGELRIGPSTNDILTDINGQNIAPATVAASTVAVSGSGSQCLQAGTTAFFVDCYKNTVSVGSNTATGAQAGSSLYVYNPNVTTQAGMLLNSFSGSDVSPGPSNPSFRTMVSRGTQEVPIALASGDTLASMTAKGMQTDGSYSASKVGIQFSTCERWTPTALCDQISFTTISSGTTTNQSRFRYENTGALSLGLVGAAIAANTTGILVVKSTVAGQVGTTASFQDNSGHAIMDLGASAGDAQVVVRLGQGAFNGTPVASTIAYNTSMRITGQSATNPWTFDRNINVGIGGDSTPDALLEVLTNADTTPSSYVFAISSVSDVTASVFGVTQGGHVVSSGTTPTVACNAGAPAMLADSNDMSGEFTGGAASANCTVTFAVPFAKKPRCFCQDGTSVLALKATTTTTTLVCTAAVSIGTDAIMYGCLAAP